MKTSELIELQRSITQGEWTTGKQHIYGTGSDGNSRCIAILSPNFIPEIEHNKTAIALVPELIDSVLKLEKALTGLLERSSSLDQSATHEGLLNCDAVAAARTVLSTIN